jgi:hypothetical protein
VFTPASIFQNKENMQKYFQFLLVGVMCSLTLGELLVIAEK